MFDVTYLLRSGYTADRPSAYTSAKSNRTWNISGTLSLQTEPLGTQWSPSSVVIRRVLVFVAHRCVGVGCYCRALPSSLHCRRHSLTRTFCNSALKRYRRPLVGDGVGVGTIPRWRLSRLYFTRRLFAWLSLIVSKPSITASRQLRFECLVFTLFIQYHTTLFTFGKGSTIIRKKMKVNT